MKTDCRDAEDCPSKNCKGKESKCYKKPLPFDLPKELDAMTTKLDAMIDQSIEAHVLDGLTWERFADVMINAKTVLEKAQEVYKEASDNSELACQERTILTP